MIRITDYALNEQRLFRDKRFIFLGESIHGVAEFTQLREEIAACYFDHAAVLVFEADSTGMLFSHQHNESALGRLKNFPKILRTQESVNLLAWAISRDIPCLGIDPIPRRPLTDFTQQWHAIRHRETDDYSSAKSAGTLFAWRDATMAEKLIALTSAYPRQRMLIMLHNLHIKREGSRERAALKLKSVREYFEEVFPGQSHSVAQLARSGSALHNDLSPFRFHITDPHSAESLCGDAACTLLTAAEIPATCTAWHHAFERETVTAKDQYEGCFIFNAVRSPVIVSS